MKKLIASILLFVSSSCVNAQLNQAWIWNEYDGNGLNSVFSLNPVNGYYTAVHTGRYISNHNDIYSITPSGTQVQHQTDAAGYSCRIVDGEINQNGDHFFVSNFADSAAPDSMRFFSVDVNFQTRFTNVFPLESPIDIELFNNELYVLSDSDKVILRKFDSNGQVLWQTTNDSMPGTNNIFPKKLKLDIAGNLYVLSRKVISGDPQFSLKKFNPSGNFIWEVLYNPTGNYDSPSDMTINDSCDIFITGESYLTSSGTLRAEVSMKIDSSGNIVWSDNYSLHSNSGRKILADNFGNSYVASTVFDIGGVRFVSVTKYDPNGNQIWQYTADSLSYVQQSMYQTIGFALDQMGNVFLGYNQDIANVSSSKFNLSKISPSGNLLAEFIIPYGFFCCYYIKFDQGNSVKLSGNMFPETASTSPPIAFTFGIDDLTSVYSSQAEFDRTAVFPNPVSGILNLSLLLKPAITYYSVTDLYGNLIYNKQSIQSDRTEIDFEKLPSGIYILNISDTDGNILKTFKITRL